MGEGARAVKKAAACYATCMARNGNNGGETLKQQRLAAALRANLLKRKAHNREAAAPEVTTGESKDE